MGGAVGGATRDSPIPLALRDHFARLSAQTRNAAVTYDREVSAREKEEKGEKERKTFSFNVIAVFSSLFDATTGVI